MGVALIVVIAKNSFINAAICTTPTPAFPTRGEGEVQKERGAARSVISHSLNNAPWEELVFVRPYLKGLT